MFIPYTILTIALGIAGLIVTLLLLRRHALHPSYAFWWTGIALGIVMLGCFPQFFDSLAIKIGVHHPPALFIVAAIPIILVRLLMADIERTRMTMQIRTLAQEHAQVRHRLKMLENTVKKEQP